MEELLNNKIGDLRISSEDDEEESREILYQLVRRCQIFLNICLFRNSLQCSESLLKTIPELSPELPEGLQIARLRVIDLKAKSLFGLGEYGESLNFLGRESKVLKHISLKAPRGPTPYLRYIQHWHYLLDRGKFLQAQKIIGNRIDMSSFVPNRKVKLDVDLVPEFIGSMIEVGVIIAGKGRGVVAVEGIPKGTLIMATRAVDIIFDTEDEDDDLEQAIAQRMRLDPLLIPEVYKLHAGNDKRNCDNNKDAIDLNRIADICTMNSFGNTRNPSGYGHNSRGLWVKASFFNHDCIDFNCVWKVLGDFIFVRTCKDVKKGEELLISYTDSAEPFEEREKFFQAHQFACTCRLCQFQSQENKDVREKRLKILKQLEILDDKEYSARINAGFQLVTHCKKKVI